MSDDPENPMMYLFKGLQASNEMVQSARERTQMRLDNVHMGFRTAINQLTDAVPGIAETQAMLGWKDWADLSEAIRAALNGHDHTIRDALADAAVALIRAEQQSEDCPCMMCISRREHES